MEASTPEKRTMRAAILYGREDVRIETIPIADLRPGEIRVRIEAALTCGTDLKVFKRGYHARMIVPPAVFGHELAGIVAEVHPETSGWKIGERVVVANSAPCGECFFCRHDQENLCDDLFFLNGAYAESIVVPARIVEKNTLRLKPETSFVDAALTEPFACVVQGVRDVAPRGKEGVLVIGSGPIGLMFVALLRHLGCDVTLAGRGKERLAAAAKAGAHTFDVGTDGDLGAMSSALKHPFDIVIEAVGKPELWEAAVKLVRKGGAVNFFGGCPAGTSVQFDTGLIHYSNLTMRASFHHCPATFRKALALIEEGLIRAGDFVSGARVLSELPQLLGEMARGNRAVKTLITP